MTPKEFFAFAKEHKADMVDLKFTDLLGSWQHCSFPIETWDEDTFKEGVGFDGSSIRGWQAINVSDMLAVPDPSTAVIDPFFAEPTVSVIADIVDPITGEDYTRDPRHVARKAIEHLKGTGLADMCFIGPEPEFFIFDEVRYEQTQHRGFYQIDSVEGAWNTARFEEPNLGYKPSYKGGYFPVSPSDTYHDLRGEMVREMKKVGITVEAHHHEVGTAGQGEIDMKFEPLLLGSGQRNSMRLALGLCEYIGMRTAADRLRADMARLTGASKPGTSRRYELLVGAAKASTARACLRIPPTACNAIRLRPAYSSPANSGSPSFHSEMCVCMPLPLSSKIGLGMNVTDLPWRLATFLMMYLNHMN